MIIKRSLRNLALLALLLLPLAAQSFSSDAIDGQVLEDGTGLPVGGAIIIARWKGIQNVVATSRTICFHVESATADETGKFHIDSWSEREGFFIYGLHMYAEAYKAGYTHPDIASQDRKIVLVKPFKGTKDEYIRNLEGIAARNYCLDGKRNKNKMRSLYRLYVQIAEDAKTIDAETPHQQMLINNIFMYESDLRDDLAKP